MTYHNTSSKDIAEQIKKFPMLTNTKKDEWETVNLTSLLKLVDSAGNEYFNFDENDTKGFDECTPFYDNLESEDPERLNLILQEQERNRNNYSSEDGEFQGWTDSCQYCGHGIIHPFRIKNIEKKLVMTIGSHCVKSFKNVDEFTKIFRIKRDNYLINSFKRWFIPIKKDIWTNPKFAKVEYYVNGVRKQIPHKKYINFIDKIDSLNDSIQGGLGVSYILEIKKIFRRAEKLGLTIPVYAPDLIYRKGGSTLDNS